MCWLPHFLRFLDDMLQKGKQFHPLCHLTLILVQIPSIILCDAMVKQLRYLRKNEGLCTPLSKAIESVFKHIVVNAYGSSVVLQPKKFPDEPHKLFN